MMLDADIVAVSSSSVYRVLKGADLLSRWKGKVSKKGTGFRGPKNPHEHWHIDISYLNVRGTFYYLISISLALVGVQLMVAYVQMQVLEALRQRNNLVIEDIRRGAAFSENGGKAPATPREHIA